LSRPPDLDPLDDGRGLLGQLGARARGSVRAAFGSSAFARSIVSAICSLIAARSTSASVAGGRLLSDLGVAPESNVRRRRNLIRTSVSSHCGENTNASPLASPGSASTVSRPASCTSTHARIALRSCGDGVRIGISVSICVSTSLFSDATALRDEGDAQAVGAAALDERLERADERAFSPMTRCGMYSSASSQNTCSGSVLRR
jgi:hypothetical protein